MRKQITKYLFSVMIIVAIIMGLFHYTISTKSIKKNMEKMALFQMNQIEATIHQNNLELENLWDSLSEDYLTRAKAFAYIIQQKPEVLESQEELQRIKELLNVDELHVVDENGILRYGTIPKYFGMDFDSTDQTREFLEILSNPDFELVQDIRPNGAEGKLFQYIGVARIDEPGIVEIGINPSRYIEAKSRNELSYIFERFPMEKGKFMVALDAETKERLACTDTELVEKLNINFSDDKFLDLSEHKIASYEENGAFFILKQYKEMILCIGQLEKDLYVSRKMDMHQVIGYLTFICIIAVSLLDFLLKKTIVDRIYDIIKYLKKITRGNLDTTVNVRGNPEFEQLSEEINQMVGSILDNTVKISKIIEAVGMPMGAYEYKQDMQRVMATDKVAQILNLSIDSAKQLYQNKAEFSKYMKQIFQKELENGIYKISDNPEKWIQWKEVSEKRSTFGVIQDVTVEVLKREQLRQERDFDALTKLYSRRYFEEKVKELLALKETKNVAMIMLDLDYFKQINDKYGHDFGDVYLKHAAKVFLRWKIKNCIIGRRSGDEFYIFIYNCAEKGELEKHLNNLYETIQAHPIGFPDGTDRILQVSSGYLWSDEGKESFEVLLEAADIALYQAKKHQKGKFCEYYVEQR